MTSPVPATLGVEAQPAAEPRVEAKPATFKVGQRVRLVSNGGYLSECCKVGSLGTVAAIGKHGYIEVALDGQEHPDIAAFTFYPDEIEPATSAQSHDAKGEGEKGVQVAVDDFADCLYEGGKITRLLFEENGKPRERFGLIQSAFASMLKRHLRAALLAAVDEAVRAERERCAKVCDEIAKKFATTVARLNYREGATDCAASIRASRDAAGR